jgi:hypothetical protein
MLLLLWFSCYGSVTGMVVSTRQASDQIYVVKAIRYSSCRT